MGGQGFSSFPPAPRLEGEPPLPALGLREPRAEQLHWAQGQEQRAGCLQGTEAPRRCCPAREAAGPGRGLWDLLRGGDRVLHGAQYSPGGPRALVEKGPWNPLCGGDHMSHSAQHSSGGCRDQEPRRCSSLWGPPRHTHTWEL